MGAVVRCGGRREGGGGEGRGGGGAWRGGGGGGGGGYWGVGEHLRTCLSFQKINRNGKTIVLSW